MVNNLDAMTALFCKMSTYLLQFCHQWLPGCYFGSRINGKRNHSVPRSKRYLKAVFSAFSELQALRAAVAA
jgi:hypothetical protein